MPISEKLIYDPIIDKMNQSWLWTILGLLAVLVGVLWFNNRTVPVELTKLAANFDQIGGFENYAPNRNSFRNYFRRDIYKGKRVDWKPSLPYYHLTPDFGHYANQGKEDCLQPGSPEL